MNGVAIPKKKTKRSRKEVLKDMDKFRFYKGDICKVCRSPITIKNKSGFCRKHRQFSEETKKKISESKMKEKNGMWKGDNVGLKGLHKWVKSQFPMTKLCQCCKKVPPRDLANISQKYMRDLSDWEWLCRKCHMTKDGRFKNLKQFRDN